MSDASTAEHSNLTNVDSREDIRKRLDAHKPEISILRGNEFCNKEDFLDNAPESTLDIISKIFKSERSIYQAEFLGRKGEEELLTAVNTGSTAALANAIALGSLAIKTLRYCWRLTENDTHLDDTIYYFMKTVELESPDEPNRALHLDDLGMMLLERYTRHHQEEDYTAATAAFQQASDLPHSAKPLFLSHLARLLKAKAMHSESLIRQQLLDESLSTHYRALQSVTPQYRGTMQMLYSYLVDAFVNVYVNRGTNPPQQLDTETQERLRDAKEAWRFYHELGISLLKRYFSQYLEGDLELSLGFLQSALAQMEKTNANTAVVDATIAEVLEQMAICDGSPAQFAEAIQSAEKAINATNPADPSMADRMATLCVLHHRVFDLTDDVQAMNNAIETGNRALGASGCDHFRWKFHHLLGVAHGYRFKATRNTSDLEASISFFEAALKEEKLVPFDRMNAHHEYARAMSFAYPVTQKQEHIDTAIHHHQKALDLCAEDSPSIVFCYEAFSITYMNKFEVTGEADDIHKATSYGLQALSNVDRFPGRERNRSRYLTGLGNAFYAQYDMSEQTADLNQAIFYYDQSVKHTRPTDARFFSRTGSLCRALVRQFAVTENYEHLDAVKDRIQSALARNSPAPSTSNSTFLLGILGTGYLYAYYLREDGIGRTTETLDCAIEQFEAALNTGCTNPLMINPPTINMLNASITRYSLTKSDEDLVKTATLVMKHMPTIQPSLTRHEFSFLIKKIADFCTLFYRSKQIYQFGLFAVAMQTAVSMNQSITNSLRLDSALEAARLSYQVLSALKPEGAAQIIKYAADLLPATVLIATSRVDQLRALKQVALLPSLGIAFYLAGNRSPSDALQIYEQTRSLIWNRSLDLKGDISELEDKHPEMAARLKEVRAKMDRGPSQAVIASEVTARSRLAQTRLAHEYNELISAIRKQDGFKDFLAPKPPSIISDSAKEGPIIVLNATQYRSDALLVTSSGITSIPLPRFSQDTAIRLATDFQSALDMMIKDHTKAAEIVNEVLISLWDVVAEPVLDALGLKGEEGDLPRVWWLMTKWISFLPIHAAGDHAKARATGEKCSVLDRAISSYIPTLRLLDHVRASTARLSAAPKNPHFNQALLVQMPTTPGQPSLSNATAEINAVEKVLRSSFQTTILTLPKRAEVLAQMKTARIAHFACHGVAEAKDPSTSKLLLHDWKTSPLDVRRIMASSPTCLEFVYLSACETASTKASKLQEECIHLSSTFQLVGVPYVIATLWAIEDEVAVDIAKSFYENILGQSNQPNLSQSARVLHNAVMQERNKGVEALFWAPFIHSGA
ncbi:CHAT domain-containing protein [Panaeolus papilionaceus]|nr:CHAT domain-containing protein [Panaeolus papilionaceus]